MDVRQLAVLRELGDRGSVTAVAAALYVTPSAVSQQLSALQRPISVPLTRRSGRRLVLTDAGQALAAAAADVASAVAAAEQAVAAFMDGTPTMVRVAAFDSAARAFFPPLLATTSGAGSRVECADEDVAQERFPALCADYDIVLAHRPLHVNAWPTTVVATPLLNEPLDIALPRGHHLAQQGSVSATDVVDEPWIAVHPGFPLMASLDAISGVAGTPVRIVHRINDFAIAADLVASGEGIALMPRYTCPPNGDVVLRSLSDLQIGRRIDALGRPDKTRRASVAAVLVRLEEIGAALSEGAPSALDP